MNTSGTTPKFVNLQLDEKQGNRLTRRPCKGDRFEIETFEAN
jgi:hypothetical protein